MFLGHQHAITLRWRHNDHGGVSDHQPHHCLLNSLFWRRSKKTSKLRVTGLREGNSPVPVNSPHKGPVTRKMFPFDDVIMICEVFYRFMQEINTYPSLVHSCCITWSCNNMKSCRTLFSQDSYAFLTFCICWNEMGCQTFVWQQRSTNSLLKPAYLCTRQCLFIIAY